MVHFRPVHLAESKGVRAEGWAVERTALGEMASIVSRLFPTRAEAKAEADRLTAQEARKTP